MRLAWAEPVVATVGSSLVRGLATTWRMRERGAEHAHAFREMRHPCVCVSWHSRLLPLLYHHRHQSIVLLVSRHRDGAYLTALAEGWGYQAVRGSSRRGGEVGLLGVVRSLQGGARVAVTPDGPRGPAEIVKGGAVAAAQHAGVPLLPLGARASAEWRMNSWDRLSVPKPFAEIEVVYGAPLEVGPGREGLRRAIAEVQRALHEVNYGV